MAPADTHTHTHRRAAALQLTRDRVERTLPALESPPGQHRRHRADVQVASGLHVAVTNPVVPSSAVVNIALGAARTRFYFRMTCHLRRIKGLLLLCVSADVPIKAALLSTSSCSLLISPLLPLLTIICLRRLRPVVSNGHRRHLVAERRSCINNSVIETLINSEKVGVALIIA